MISKVKIINRKTERQECKKAEREKGRKAERQKDRKRDVTTLCFMLPKKSETLATN